MSTLTLELSEEIIAELEQSARAAGRTAAEEARARLERERHQRLRVEAELEELRRFRDSLKMAPLTDSLLAEARKAGRR